MSAEAPYRSDPDRYRGRVGAMLKQDDALALYVKGLTYAQIAEKLGYAHKSGAHKAVGAALDRHHSEAEELAERGRAIALARLRPLWIRALENALAEDGGAKDILAAAQIADRMQRLEGVKDPATEVRMTIESELDREIEVLLAALGRAGADPATVLRESAR